MEIPSRVNQTPKQRRLRQLLEEGGHTSVKVWWCKVGSASEMCGQTGGFFFTSDQREPSPLGVTISEAIHNVNTLYSKSSPTPVVKNNSPNENINKLRELLEQRGHKAVTVVWESKKELKNKGYNLQQGYYYSSDIVTHRYLGGSFKTAVRRLEEIQPYKRYSVLCENQVLLVLTEHPSVTVLMLEKLHKKASPTQYDKGTVLDITSESLKLKLSKDSTHMVLKELSRQTLVVTCVEGTVQEEDDE